MSHSRAPTNTRWWLLASLWSVMGTLAVLAIAEGLSASSGTFQRGRTGAVVWSELSERVMRDRFTHVIELTSPPVIGVRDELTPWSGLVRRAPAAIVSA